MNKRVKHSKSLQRSEGERVTLLREALTSLLEAARQYLPGTDEHPAVRNAEFALLQESSRKNPTPSGPWVVLFEIDTDDDFELDTGSSFSIDGETEAEARQKAVDSLRTAQFTYLKTWGTNATGMEEDWVRGDYSAAWFTIRDAAIAALEEGEMSFHFGGNQTISLSVCRTMFGNQSNIVDEP